MTSSFNLAKHLHSSDFRLWTSPGILKVRLCVHLGIFILKIGLKQSMIN